VHPLKRITLVASALTIAPLVAVACGGRSATTSSSGSRPATSASASPATSAAGTSASIATTVRSSVPATVTTTSSSTAVAPSTTTVDAAAIKAQITANWERFFLPSTSIADRTSLLQNGIALRAALEQRAKDPLQQQASAKVTSIDLDAPGHAVVTYYVSLNGAVALPDAQGVAVLQDGVWKVSADSFCALISLGATEPIPGCS
jgi:hypothetical protein